MGFFFKKSVCVCVCMLLLHIEYQNLHSTSKEGAFVEIEHILAGPHNFKVYV